MKRVITVIICFLLFCGCARSDGEYERGYADGYAAAMSELSRAIPEITSAPTARPTSTPRPTVSPSATPQPTTAPTSDDFTVYVSSSGTMHLKEDCSGMKHSTAMPYSVASQYYDKRCKHCFKKEP